MIKGIPWPCKPPVQSRRGRGDCDLFVDPSQWGAAIALLLSVGFRLSYGASCVGDDSLRGSYCRFVSIEISLYREIHNRRQLIDLHWHATWARGILPRFQKLWQRGEVLPINGQLVRTLSGRDALLHACCHAAVDRYMTLRNLVDIDRLERALPPTQLVELSHLRPVRNGLLARAAAFKMNSALPRFGSAQHVRIAAEVAQQLPPRSLGDGGWTVANRLRFRSHGESQPPPLHVFSTLMRQLITP